MIFYNKIDYLRKTGDLLAIIIFLILIYYINKSNITYKNYIMAVLFIFAIFDLIFTVDAIKIHGIKSFIKPQFI